MPLVSIESSVALPAHERATVLATLVATVERTLAVQPPTQVRVRLTDVDASTVAVGDAIGDPWVVAFVHMLEGRPEAAVAAFMSEFAETIARAYGVDVKHVRVLVSTYPKVYWGIGSQSAAALR
jgi:phenylpyruvate tautomerase PptA (4-oxalocrotonate tautomerase family)